MLSLYEILKASKTSIAPDMWTALAGANFGGAGSGAETKEITGIPPISIRSNGTMLLDYLISGNMSQTGTPTPTTPIQPQETGDRTGNLFELTDSSATSNTLKTLVDFGTDVTYDIFTCSCVFDNLEAENAYGAFIDYLMDDGTHQYVALSGMLNVNDDTRYPTNVKVNGNYYNTKRNITFRKIQVYLYTTGYNNFKSGIIKWAFYGSEKKDYEPYGIKIPISSANTTTPIYLGEVPTTRRIKKMVLTGDEDWVLEYTDNFLLNTPIDNAQPLQLVICTHQQSISTGYETDANFENVRISQMKKLNFRTRTIPHNLSDFKAYLAQQYANGTPVTVWYVLANETTGIVNEPIRKIGDYADTVSYEQAGVQIPTNRGNTVIDVDTTLKPSEMYIKYQR